MPNSALSTTFMLMNVASSVLVNSAKGTQPGHQVVQHPPHRQRTGSGGDDGVGVEEGLAVATDSHPWTHRQHRHYRQHEGEGKADDVGGKRREQSGHQPQALGEGGEDHVGDDEHTAHPQRHGLDQGAGLNLGVWTHRGVGGGRAGHDGYLVGLLRAEKLFELALDSLA